LEVVITGVLVGADRIAAARRMDRWSRGIFPALFAVLVLWTFVR